MRTSQIEPSAVCAVSPNCSWPVSAFRLTPQLKGSDSLTIPKPNTDGLFYTAYDAGCNLRVGWLSNPDGADYANISAWIDALREMLEETPDLHLLMVRRQPFSDFAEIVEKCA